MLKADLLGEGGWVGADAQVGLSGRLVDILKAVAVRVHDQTCAVIEQHAHAVVTQLVAWKRHRELTTNIPSELTPDHNYTPSYILHTKIDI